MAHNAENDEYLDRLIDAVKRARNAKKPTVIYMLEKEFIVIKTDDNNKETYSVSRMDANQEDYAVWNDISE